MSTRASRGPGDPPNNSFLPLSRQAGITNIQPMKPSDNKGGFDKPGYEIDYSKSMKGQRGGEPVYQPYYVKKKGSTGTSTTTTPPSPKPKSEQKPAPKPAQKPAPKERTASRIQTIIGADGKKTVKNVVYSKYDEKSRKWVDQDAPLVIDYRTNEKKYQGGKVVKF